MALMSRLFSAQHSRILTHSRKFPGNVMSGRDKHLRCFSHAFKEVVDFQKWMGEHGPSLVPPVANKLLFGDGFLKVMVVGGPNNRKDYHLQGGEEFFWQIKGNLSIHAIINGRFQVIDVPEGHCYLLPSRVPHSPRRDANSIGLVIERSHEHDTEELDRVRWYEDDTKKGSLAAIDDGGLKVNADEEYTKVKYEQHFHCLDLGTELAPVIKNFMKLEENNELSGWDREASLKKKGIANIVTLANEKVKADEFGQPFKFDDFIESQLKSIHNKECPVTAEVVNMWQGVEKSVDLVLGTGGSIGCGELSGKVQQSLLYQVRGKSHVITLSRKVYLNEGELMLVDAAEGTPIVTQQETEESKDGETRFGATLVIRNCLKAVA